MTRETAEYVERVYSIDVRTLVETLVLLTFNKYPDDPAAANASETAKHKMAEESRHNGDKEDRFEEDLKKVYSLIWGQCTSFST